MGRIKTREKARSKDTDALDRSAVVGQRMKSAFLRAKRNAAAQTDDGQATPTEYADDLVQSASDNLFHDAVNVSASGMKMMVRQGQKLFWGQREKKTAEKQWENAAPAEQPQTAAPDFQNSICPKEQFPQQSGVTAPEGRLSRQNTGTSPERRLPRQRTDATTKGKLPRQHTDTPPEGQLHHQHTGRTSEERLPHRQSVPKEPNPRPHRSMAERGQSDVRTNAERSADILDIVVERGRAFVKRQSEKRTERKRQKENQSVQAGGPAQPQRDVPEAARTTRQMEAASSQPFKTANNSLEPVKPSCMPASVKLQTAPKSSRQQEPTAKWAGNSVESPMKKIKPSSQAAGQTAKTVNREARGTARSGQRTIKTIRQSTNYTVKTARRIKDGTTAAVPKMVQTTAKFTATALKTGVKGIVTTGKAVTSSAKALVAAITTGGGIAVLAIMIICLIGLTVGSCFGIFFSGEDTGTGSTIPAVVREINQDYEDRLNEIKSTAHDELEMSGSCASWTEVLAVYAVKTTTDPNHSQEVATTDDDRKELLKEIFWSMNEISSRTEIHTTEAGDGTEITTTLYITVTHKTAEEMADTYNFTSDQRRQLAELLADGNRDMWSSLLYGTGTGDGEIVEVALSQIGNTGGRPYWSWYGFGGRVEWCACFVSWCANECGHIDSGVVPKFAGCVNGAQWFKDRGQWQDRSFTPEAGQIIFFDWHGDGVTDHVGIVERCENGVVYTVEGNTGDACQQWSYPVGSSSIYGYGIPAY